MRTKLARHGNSLALVFDDDLLELLQIDDQTSLELTTDGRHLIISKCAGQLPGEGFAAPDTATTERYAKNFRRLAG